MPSELDQAPSAQYVRELWDWNKNHWAKQITLDTQLVDLYFDEHAIPVPDTDDPNRKNRIEPERMSTGEAARVVDTITNFFVPFASIGLMWLGKGKSPAAHDDTEIALAEVRDQLNPVIDAPRTTTVFQKVLLGRSAEIFLPGDKAWWDFPKFQQKGYEGETNEAFMEREKDWRRKAPVPIFWKALPAESTFPGSLGRIDEEVLSTVEMSWAELLRIFSREELGSLLPKERKDWNQVATLGTYANRKVVSHVVLGTGEDASSKAPDRIIRSVEHKMGRCAIRILPGRTTAWKEPGKHWRSVLFPVLKLLEGLDKRMSEAATASKFSSLPVLKAKLNQSDEDNDFLDKVINGDIIELSAGGDGMPAEDIEALFMPPYGEKTIALAGFLQDRIERMTGASPAIEGSFGPSGQPAWSRSFSADLAKNFQAPLTDKIIAADIDNMEMVMLAVESFGEDIVLQRHGDGKGAIILEAKGITDWIPKLKGTYQLSTVANEEARFDLGMSLLERADATNAPLSPEFIAQKFWGIEQPLVEWKKKLIWDFIRSPELRKFQMDKLLEEADVGLAEDEGMSLEEFEQLASRVPEPARSTIRQKAGGGVNPQTQGLIQATSAFSRTEGGPKPQSQEQVT